MTSEGYYGSLLTHMTTRWLGVFTCDKQLYQYNINNFIHLQQLMTIFNSFGVPLLRNYLGTKQPTTNPMASLICELKLNQ